MVPRKCLYCLDRQALPTSFPHICNTPATVLIILSSVTHAQLLYLPNRKDMRSVFLDVFVRIQYPTNQTDEDNFALALLNLGYNFLYINDDKIR